MRDWNKAEPERPLADVLGALCAGRPPMSLRVTAPRSVRWTAASTASNLGARFLVILFAAHRLLPSDLGLYALVNLVLVRLVALAGGEEGFGALALQVATGAAVYLGLSIVFRRGDVVQLAGLVRARA